MTNVSVLSKEPPGGRCTLYIRYAEAINRCLDIPSQVKYCESDQEDGSTPPALLIGETIIQPSDGVIVSPEDLTSGLQDKVSTDNLNKPHKILDAVQDQLMEEWDNG